jgi:hypothetical protein
MNSLELEFGELDVNKVISHDESNLSLSSLSDGSEVCIIQDDVASDIDFSSQNSKIDNVVGELSDFDAKEMGIEECINAFEKLVRHYPDEMIGDC